MRFKTKQELVHMDRTCVAKNIFGETRVSKTSNSRNLETEVSPWKRVRCNIFRSHYARGILKSPIILYWCWLTQSYFLAEFSNPVWQLDYIFSEKYPSSNKFLNADRIDELNQQLLNQTSHRFWKGYVFSRETNYQPAPYSRFNLYCAMRFVHVNDFNKCIGKYAVPGG